MKAYERSNFYKFPKTDEQQNYFPKIINEGNYVEPDIVHDHGFLNVIKDEIYKKAYEGLDYFKSSVLLIFLTNYYNLK